MQRRARWGLALVVSLFALGIPGGGATAQTTARPPLDYSAQASKLSQPIYPKTITENVKITAADGEKLYVEITRPDPAQYSNLAPLPVILEASPYHGTIATRTGNRVFPDAVNAQGQQIGLTGYFAPRGYAVAMMDLRGTGRSTGCLDHLGPNDASDMKIVIEWLAAQEWSNGRVGMTGHSYVGSSLIAAATQKPQGLVTIVPSAGLASMYDHQFQKGVPYLLQWVGPMAAYETLAIDRDLPPGFSDPVQGGPTGDNWGAAPNPQFGCGMKNSSLTAGSGQVTGQYEGWHAARDWRAGATDLDIPVFMVHGVNDNAARIPAAEWFFNNRFDRTGDKVWLGQWDHGSTNGRCGNQNNARTLHPNCRFGQWKYALHAWFDRHLMQRTWTDEAGVSHPIDTGPAVEVFLNGRNPMSLTTVVDPVSVGGPVYTAPSWSKTPATFGLYPDATNNKLSFSPPSTAGTAILNGGVTAVLATVNAGTLTFTSDALTQDTLFVGMPELKLHASVSTGQVTHLVATLYRKDGSVEEPMNTCAIQPQLREGIDKITPVIPNQEMALTLQCFTMANWVPAGQSLVLKIRTTGPHHATFGADPRITVFTGPSSSAYSLPVVSNPTLYPDVPLRVQ